MQGVKLPETKQAQSGSWEPIELSNDFSHLKVLGRQIDGVWPRGEQALINSPTFLLRLETLHSRSTGKSEKAQP